ncbi:MAG: hypothetical protein JXC36_07485 [Candidatus Atribacteria bacterium]|nr:hypothetical protein [Candidatus Atribacteria bacterium]
MCGIFGLINNNAENSGKIFRSLFLLSESRGKEAAGFAIRDQDVIKVYKTPYPASNLVRNDIFKNEVLNLKNKFEKQFFGIGHSRLVTNGYEQYDINNQPIIKHGMIVIHNGIIVNYHELWKKYSIANRISELDTELIPTILDNKISEGNSLGDAIKFLFNEIYGMTNIALISEKYNNLILATNNGSIYYVNDLNNDFFVFASENFILKKLLQKHKKAYLINEIVQLKPDSLLSINLNLFQAQLGEIGTPLSNIETYPIKNEIVNLKDKKINNKPYLNTSLDYFTEKVDSLYIDEYEKRKAEINNIKKCTKCILPESFPFIEFDDNGVCNYCNNYHKINFRGKDSLVKSIDKYRKSNGEPECLMPFSGGRDSSYALHYVVKELGLKPIAFSYDWGMITDLARRNQARMCGSLGVEHILISADIRKKRKNIRKNVLAWLKNPNLGTIPLFMAGDKQYFYYANLLMKQNNLSLSILGENLLETTNFKSGFCGLSPIFEKGHTYTLSAINKIKMMIFYGSQYIKNPAYLNSSLFDTLDAFKSYYLIKHNNLNIYDYIKWDENIITDTLFKNYDWETDPGTKTTWRIGDGTAAFYNYIYYMVAGFTENDTFRSNQIREGDMTRETALLLSINENKPRWDSIHWYCNTIGVDFDFAINIINSIKKIYLID